MKFIFTQLVLFFFFSFFCEGQITFQKTFGGIHDETGNFVQQTTDGGYIVVGYSGTFAVGATDVYLIKTDSNGDTVWTKTFGGMDYDVGESVRQTTDGGYIITGTTGGSTLLKGDVYLIKTDVNGDSLWTKTFGGTGDDIGYSIQQTADSGYIIAGSTSSFGANISDVYLIKTDVNGDSLWTRTFGGTTAQYYSYSIQQTVDSGYIIAGFTSSFGGDVLLIKTNVSGALLWTKTFGGTGDDISYSIQQTVDGGFIIAGSTSSFGAGTFGGYNVYLIKTDANGDSLWTKTFGGSISDLGYSVQQTTDGGYIIIGVTNSFGDGNSDLYLIKTDASGDSLWTKTFGGAGGEANGGYDERSAIQQTADGGYVIVANTFSFGAGIDDVYLIKTDVNGNSGCNEGNAATILTMPATHETSPATFETSPNTIVASPPTIVGSGGVVTTSCSTVGVQSEIQNTQSEILINPNPTTSSFKISSSSPLLLHNAHIEIFNLLGEKIFSVSYCRLPLPTIDCHLFPPGIYFVSLQTEKGIAVQKLIKQ